MSFHRRYPYNLTFLGVVFSIADTWHKEMFSLSRGAFSLHRQSLLSHDPAAQGEYTRNQSLISNRSQRFPSHALSTIASALRLPAKLARQPVPILMLSKHLALSNARKPNSAEKKCNEAALCELHRGLPPKTMK